MTKLIGATDAFIRRPFLYGGVWYGLLGGLIAWVLIATSMSILDEPVERLSSLYHSSYVLSGLSASNTAYLLAISCLLGFAGSWIAVSRHLKDIEPS